MPVKILIPLLVLLGLSIAVIKHQEGLSSTQTADNETTIQLRESISRDIDKNPQIAYQNFKKMNLANRTFRQHKLAHMFGELLFQKMGEKGISVCDDTFLYGCYHGFLSEAVYLKGMNEISSLNSNCLDFIKDKVVSRHCQHGLGHGILAMLGYKPDNLRDALARCDSVQVRYPNQACQEGVFMEYNLKFLLADSGNGNPRTFDSANPYSPCTEVDPKYQTTCYFLQSQWWIEALKGKPDQKYSQISPLCEKIDNPINRKGCFLGLGQMAGPVNNWNVPKEISLCQSLPDKEGQQPCLRAAAKSYIEESYYGKEDASLFCLALGLKLDNTSCISLSEQPLLPEGGSQSEL